MSALLEMPVKAESEIPEYTHDPVHWTVDEFCEMLALPKFQDRKYILIDGEIIKMGRPNPPHEGTMSIVDYFLKALFGVGYVVRVNSGFRLGFETEPIPDIAVVTGSPRDYATRHPETGILFVEIADSSLALDLRVKSHLYAAAKVPEYWVIDVNSKRLHLHRDPVADSDAPRGFRYASVQVLTADDSFAPLAFPEKTVRVADLLP